MFLSFVATKISLYVEDRNRVYFLKARSVMMSSKLPTATLGKVWDLSDIDRDGFLDRYEFTVAMHLVFRALQVIK